MYLHAGGDVVVAVADIIAILDGRAVAGSEINQEFVRRADQVRRISGSATAQESRGRPRTRSWVVTVTGTYPSGISPATLARRMSHFGRYAASWRAET